MGERDMVFFFWNTNRRDLAALIGQASRLHDLDVIILAENDQSWATLAAHLNVGQSPTYRPAIALGQTASLALITRLPEGSVAPLADYPGLSFRSIAGPMGPSLTLGMTHLRSKLHQGDTDQAYASTVVRQRVTEVEDRVGHRRTVLVGDFNMNPFEDGMVSAGGLHAVSVRAIAERAKRTVDGEEYRFFYNPMWGQFGDRPPRPPGTYYYSRSHYVEYFWNIFDQVLVRPELLYSFDDNSIRILSAIGTTELRTPSGIPNATSASDHLPLVFSINVERCHA